LFSQCNPGYTSFADPGRELAVDAHRLVIRVCLALAALHVKARPPRFLEAVQEWVRGRTLAGVLGESEAFAEYVLGQVMGLLEGFWKQPEQATALLERALSAVPSPTLHGRLADRLTERGITRCNADQWEEGAQDLRWATRLNRHSSRAQYNLCLALKNLAITQVNDGKLAVAAETAEELKQRAVEARRVTADVATYQPLLEWAEQQAASWKSLASLSQDDPLALLEELNRRADA
jgi:hypothetical protein